MKRDPGLEVGPGYAESGTGYHPSRRLHVEPADLVVGDVREHLVLRGSVTRGHGILVIDPRVGRTHATCGVLPLLALIIPRRCTTPAASGRTLRSFTLRRRREVRPVAEGAVRGQVNRLPPLGPCAGEVTRIQIVTVSASTPLGTRPRRDSSTSVPVRPSLFTSDDLTSPLTMCPERTLFRSSAALKPAGPAVASIAFPAKRLFG